MILYCSRIKSYGSIRHAHRSICSVETTHPPIHAKQVILKALPFFRIAAGPDAPLRPWRRARAPTSPGAPSREGAIFDDEKLLGSRVAQDIRPLSPIVKISSPELPESLAESTVDNADIHEFIDNAI